MISGIIPARGLDLVFFNKLFNLNFKAMKKLGIESMENIVGNGGGDCAYTVIAGVLGIVALAVTGPIGIALFALGVVAPPKRGACDYID